MKEKSGTWYLITAVLIAASCYAVTELLQLLLQRVVSAHFTFSPEGAAVYAAAVNLSVSVIMLLLIRPLYRRVRRGRKGVVIRMNRNYALKCVACGIGLAGFIRLFSHLNSGTVQAAGAGGAAEILLGFAAAVLIAPVIEEMLFRGIIFGLLSRYRGGWFAMLLSSLLSAVYRMDPVRGIYTFAVGFILADIYRKTKNLRYPVLIHGAGNAFLWLTGVFLQGSLRPWFEALGVLMIIPTLLIILRDPIGKENFSGFDEN